MMIQKKTSASPHDDCDMSLLHAPKLKNKNTKLPLQHVILYALRGFLGLNSKK
jgi:hypothetical protein